MRPLADWRLPDGLGGAIPVVAARSHRDGQIETLSAGHWPNGAPVVDTDRFYLASLAKQVTGVALALLVRDGVVEPDRPVGSYLSGLPAWTAAASVRQIAHHIAALPLAGTLEREVEGDWTEPAAFGALERAAPASAGAGERFGYSNIGYTLLARLVAAVSGMPFAEFVTQRILAPLGLDEMGFASGVRSCPQVALMGTSLPLTHGDGGMWASARAFARWLHLQNTDAWGVAGMVQGPGRLRDGSEVPYGWGIGVRAYRGAELFIHGGEWTGCAAKAVRSPTLGIGVVAMAAGAPIELVNQLVSDLLDDAADSS
jgi:CubicO group peptidase (beta-lactamase class C family)